MRQKKNWKKIWSLFLCMSMVTSCMPITTLAEAANEQIVYDTEVLADTEAEAVSDVEVESESTKEESEENAAITEDTEAETVSSVEVESESTEEESEENAAITEDTEAETVSDVDVESESTKEESDPEQAASEEVLEPVAEEEQVTEETAEETEVDAEEQVDILRKQIQALPTIEELESMSMEEQQTVYEDVQAICDAYEALTEEEKELLTEEVEKLEALFEYFSQLLEETENEEVSYLIWDNEKGKLVNADPITEYEKVTSASTSWNGGTTGSPKATYYVVQESVTISRRVTVSGDVHLILCNSATLTVNGGINVSEGNKLTIYAQTENEIKGKLVVENVGQYNAGIGGGNNEAGGTITIVGGNITAKASCIL